VEQIFSRKTCQILDKLNRLPIFFLYRFSVDSLRSLIQHQIAMFGNKFERSAIAPTVGFAAKSSTGVQKEFYQSRAKSIGGGTSRFNGGVSFAGMKSSIGFKRSQQIAQLTTLKHDLQQSRIIQEDEVVESGLINMIDGVEGKSLFDRLHSTSGRPRLPQNDVEFARRARAAGEQALEIELEAMSVSSKSDQKKKEAENLMACIKRCGYEFDNEKTFNANKLKLLQAARVVKTNRLPAEDTSEPDDAIEE